MRPHFMNLIFTFGCNTKRMHCVAKMHLVKWQYQPQFRSRSWMLTISNQRQALRDIIEASPSLKPLLVSTIDSSWIRAKRDAEIETGIKRTHFPQNCPWQADQFIHDDFWSETQ